MSDLTLAHFDYQLPPEFIAQQPMDPRDHSRLMVLDRAARTIAHHHFFDLKQLLRSGDVLVLNNTKVMPVRFVGTRTSTGGRWQGLLVARLPGEWEMLSRCRGHLLASETISLSPSGLTLTFLGRTERGTFRYSVPADVTDDEVMQQAGLVPLPPYIRHGDAEPSDQTRYQTVFADRPGAVAAPTAGLHFTRELLDQLIQQGVIQTTITLHVGRGTFEPVKELDINKHTMHEEWYELSAGPAQILADARRDGRRIIGVGTTVARTLQTVINRHGQFVLDSGETKLFIKPGDRFDAIDALITNFHVPKSTLLMLVSAFADRELVLHAYESAKASNYRFFSYGDAMMIT